ncbi:MiaB/RimO family radical SAM methylthiotransferase [Candidatus Dojkabacteria bacterium]|nr:MiaB/RimO family radical SAM methylthiotransferase [Candidatus Dojkabacteria bacterium]
MKARAKLKTYLLKTYGCQMNYSDSERIESVLQNAALKPANSVEKADIIVFNTCSVRQSAEDRILGLKKNIQILKRAKNQKLRDTKYELPITVLTGCMAQRCWNVESKRQETEGKRYLAKLRRRAPWIDLIIPIKEIVNIRRLLTNQPSDHPGIRLPDYLAIRPSLKSNHSAYIPISTGCNEFCSYCIVPYARGKLINRPASEILSDIQELVSRGYKDIMILGQNVNAWKNPENKPPKDFTDLLKEVDKINGDFWLSFLSSHPNNFTTSLLNYFTKSANKGTENQKRGKKLTVGNHIRPYLNLALQSGSNRILKKMNRKYSVEKFIDICSELKEKYKNLNLSTDIIIGFPGETNRDFNKTADVMKRLEFDMAYINKYSPRNFTIAEKFGDNIPWKVKKEREVELTRILRKSAFKNNKRYVGKKSRVLIDKIDKKKGIAFGKTFGFKDVRLSFTNDHTPRAGKFVEVKITKSNTWSLEGILYPQD